MLSAAPSDALLPHLVNLQRVQDQISQSMNYDQLDVQNDRDELQTRNLYEAFSAELQEFSSRFSSGGIIQSTRLRFVHRPG
jgi:hypothetical protein